jgi:hypothetical protein
MPQQRDLGFQLRLRPEGRCQHADEQPKEVEHQPPTLAHLVDYSSPDEIFSKDRRKAICRPAVSASQPGGKSSTPS